eukprot:COSAG03_NODE_9016_length_751_cov_160.507669_2_plen_54_part_01
MRHRYAKTLGSGKGSDDPPPIITAAMLMTGSSGIDHKWTGTYAGQSILAPSVRP